MRFTFSARIKLINAYSESSWGPTLKNGFVIELFKFETTY